MEEKRLWELVARRAAGEAGEEELEELNRLLEKYPEAIYTMETMDHYWNDQKDQVAIVEREEAIARHLQRFQQEKESNVVAMRKRGVLLRRMLIGAAAAAAVVLLTASIWYFRSVDNKGNNVQVADKRADSNNITRPVGKKMMASNGAKNHLTLPDGSKVWLNAGSTLTWEDGWNTKAVREVTLTGEGFFEVRHDEHHPFVIHTSRMDIRDVGTSFNVKAYPSDSTTEATLIEGAIEVTLKNEQKKTLLSTPNEKVIVYNHKPSVITKVVLARTITDRTDSLIAETAWMKDMLVFRNENFGALAVRMERWYDVTILFNNEKIRQHRFTGIFSNETVEQALNELKLIYPFSYTYKNGTIVIQ